MNNDPKTPLEQPAAQASSADDNSASGAQTPPGGSAHASPFKAWYQANREEFLARRRARYHSDPEAHARQLKAAKRWKLEHPQKSTGSVRKIHGTVTPVHRIGAVAKVLDRTVQILRQWEQKGWVPAASQKQGEHRVYTQHQVQLMGQLAAFLTQHRYDIRHDDKVRLQFNELVKEIKVRWDEVASSASDDEPM